MKRTSRTLKWLLPFVVSASLLVYLFSTIDTSGVMRHVTRDVLLIFVPTLLVYGAGSLWIEAYSLLRLLPDSEGVLDLWTAARMKAASYLLYVINYTLGAGALAVLLRRRARIRIADGGGVVFLIALFDLGLLILVCALSLALQSSGAPAFRAGAVGLAGALIVAGFVFLRTPLPLGPLERLRSFAFFRAARHTPLALLIEVASLRFVFVICFIAVAWSCMLAFGIHVPLPVVVVNIAVVAMVATLPIAAAGIGTSQVAFVEVFKPHFADEGTLLACSLTFSVGMILLRSGMGFVFSREYVREALEAVQEEPESA